LSFNGGSVAGQGLGAFNAYGVDIRVEGGAQDGVGKAISAARSPCSRARAPRASGSTARLASRLPTAPARPPLRPGLGDSRFCIRLSGADVVLAGEAVEPLDDARGCIVDRANAKGFAFEYMTSGRAVVLGDIGPWACAGMTGGRVYVRVSDELNLTEETIAKRLGEGAKVHLDQIDDEGALDIDELLGHYATQLRASNQDAEADRSAPSAAPPRTTS